MRFRIGTAVFALASATAAAAPRPLAKPDDALQPGERLGYIVQVPPEAPEARAARHRRVAERRAATPLLLHRGAWKFAPENTLEAFAASLDRGADGNEIDIFRSKDGVLCLNHDAAVERTLDGGGKIADLTYYELLGLRYKDPREADPQFMRMPTFAAFLLLARERAMLIHLDIKIPGIDGDLARMIEEADMWDHVVVVNDYNSETIRANPKLKRLSYKGWYHQTPKDILTRPGDMIFIEADPTDAVKAVGRKPLEKPEPLPAGLWAAWPAP